MLGYANVQFTFQEVVHFALPALYITCDRPAAACLASQFAGWILQEGDCTLYLSGPGRILVRKPKKMFNRLEELRVKVPENVPPLLLAEVYGNVSREIISKVVSEIRKVNVKDRIILLLTSARSTCGIAQICARLVEIVLLQLLEAGYDISKVRHAIANVVVPVPTGDVYRNVALANDAILYTGRVYVQIDDKLTQELDSACRRCVRQEQYTFMELVRKHGPEFLTKVTPDMFRVGELIVATRDIVVKYGIRDLNTFLKLALG
jgi:methenyltetrahydromethanopterin cyclohydrolase